MRGKMTLTMASLLLLQSSILASCGSPAREGLLHRLGLSAVPISTGIRCENLNASRTARLLTYQRIGEREHYGVYGLSGAKWSLVVPLPSQDDAIRWEGVTAAEALQRLIASVGEPQETARVLVEQNAIDWFADGLRVFFVLGGAREESSTTWPVVVAELH